MSEFPHLQNNILTPRSRSLCCSVQSLWLILLKLISCISMSSTRGKKDRDTERHGLGTERGPPRTLKNTMSSPAFCLCPGAGSPKVPRLPLNFCCSLTFHRAEITDSAVLTKINYFSIASVSPGFMKFEGKAASSFHITAISREAVIKFQCITSWLL